MIPPERRRCEDQCFSIPLVCVLLLVFEKQNAICVIVNVVIAAFMPLNLSATTLRLKFVFGFFPRRQGCSSKVISAGTQPQKAPRRCKISELDSPPSPLSMLKLHTGTASQYFDST